MASLFCLAYKWSSLLLKFRRGSLVFPVLMKSLPCHEKLTFCPFNVNNNWALWQWGILFLIVLNTLFLYSHNLCLFVWSQFSLHHAFLFLLHCSLSDADIYFSNCDLRLSHLRSNFWTFLWNLTSFWCSFLLFTHCSLYRYL